MTDAVLVKAAVFSMQERVGGNRMQLYCPQESFKKCILGVADEHNTNKMYSQDGTVGQSGICRTVWLAEMVLMKNTVHLSRTAGISDIKVHVTTLMMFMGSVFFFFLLFVCDIWHLRQWKLDSSGKGSVLRHVFFVFLQALKCILVSPMGPH